MAAPPCPVFWANRRLPAVTTAVAATPVANRVRLIGSIICVPPETSRCAVDDGIRHWPFCSTGFGSAEGWNHHGQAGRCLAPPHCGLVRCSALECLGHPWPSTSGTAPMQQTFDRTAEDLGNSIHLEHVNVTVPDQHLASLFYVTGLGLTRDPYLMVSDTNMWINVGRSQFHLPNGKPQVLRGHTALVIPGRAAPAAC